MGFPERTPNRAFTATTVRRLRQLSYHARHIEANVRSNQEEDFTA